MFFFVSSCHVCINYELACMDVGGEKSESTHLVLYVFFPVSSSYVCINHEPACRAMGGEKSDEDGDGDEGDGYEDEGEGGDEEKDVHFGPPKHHSNSAHLISYVFFLSQ